MRVEITSRATTSGPVASFPDADPIPTSAGRGSLRIGPKDEALEQVLALARTPLTDDEGEE